MAIRTVAVGIDGSAAATDAVSWAVGLARAEDADLQAVHVWQSPFVCTYPWSSPSTEQEVQYARALVRDTLAAAGADSHVESIIVRGAAGPTLTSEAAGADVLVIGRTGQKLVDYKPQFGEVMAGATARYCVNHSTGPVATIPAGAAWIDAPQVLVGIDGSPTSLAALRWATEELPADATIHATHAVTWPTPTATTEESGLGTPSEQGTVHHPLSANFGVELIDPLVARYNEALRSLVDDNLPESFVAAGRTVKTHVVLGYAQDALTNPGFPCDVIVVGEHGDTAAAVGVLGSVADHTLRHATVPLIVVPAS